MKHERKRQLVYWSALVGSFTASMLVGWGLVALLHLALDGGRHHQANFPFAFLGGAIAVSSIVAREVCRKLGLSLDLRTKEVLTREGPARLSNALGRQRVEARNPQWSNTALGAVLGLGTLSLGGLSLSCLGRNTEVLVIAGALAVLSGVAWWAWARQRGIVAEMDEAGVTRRSLLRTQRISWDDVAEVTVETEQNPVGRVTQTCVFHDPSGRVLMKLPLQLVAEESRAQFVEAIRARQGLPPGTRTELEAAMPPEGTGTEPEAAAPPPGRGTELEAASGPGRAAH